MTLAFEESYWPEGSAPTIVDYPLNAVSFVGLQVPDLVSDGGFRRFQASTYGGALTVIPGVPVGTYYMEFETVGYYPLSQPTDAGLTMVPAKQVSLHPASLDLPDLVQVSTTRRDLAFATVPTSVKLALTGLSPWAQGNTVNLRSVQLGGIYFSLRLARLPTPDAGATTLDGTFDWTSLLDTALPDSSKGDVLYFVQSTLTAAPSPGVLATYGPVRYARVTDVTIPAGGPGEITADLVPVPVATTPFDLKGAQFKALAARFDPDGGVSDYGSFVEYMAVPRSVTFPDMPRNQLYLGWTGFADGTVDQDFSPLPYGNYAPSTWTVAQALQLNFTTSGGGSMSYVASEALPTSGPVVPRIGPPTSIQIDGADVPVAHVGLQPRITWTPPTLGTATSYTVTLQLMGDPSEGDVTSVDAVVYGTSFTVPPGLLIPGRTYFFTFGVNSAPWDRLDVGRFRTGLPSYRVSWSVCTFTAG